MRIKIEKKPICGDMRNYPACKASQWVADALGKKSISDRVLDKARALGIEVEFIEKKGE